MKLNKKPANLRTVVLKVQRGELCDLILACTSLSQGENREKWKALKTKLKSILNEFDMRLQKEEEDRS